MCAPPPPRLHKEAISTHFFGMFYWQYLIRSVGGTTPLPFPLGTASSPMCSIAFYKGQTGVSRRVLENFGSPPPDPKVLLCHCKLYMYCSAHL